MKIVAKALVRDKAGNILLLRRGLTHPNFPRHFDFPGGEVEPDEPHVDAVKREIREETGLDVSLDELELAFKKQISEDLIHVLYTTSLPLDTPPVILSWEHSGYEWIPFDEMVALPLPDGVDNYHLNVLNFLDKTKS